MRILWVAIRRRDLLLSSTVCWHCVAPVFLLKTRNCHFATKSFHSNEKRERFGELWLRSEALIHLNRQCISLVAHLKGCAHAPRAFAYTLWEDHALEPLFHCAVAIQSISPVRFTCSNCASLQKRVTNLPYCVYLAVALTLVRWPRRRRLRASPSRLALPQTRPVFEPSQG